WSDDVEGQLAFHRLWTIKEAALKASGRGMRAGPRHVRVEMAWLARGGVFRLEAFRLSLQGVCGGPDDLIVAVVAGPVQA
ncbi:MAG: 4'-phosphopantetheinyl transferase superfamily protein, partial [Hyphomonas sp.]